MPRPKQSNGFILGNQHLFAGNNRAKRAAVTDTRGSWWIGVSRDEWGAKCAEVFPDLSATKEGQRAFRPWKTNGA